MKIAVFNGSPRKENTFAMVEAFKEGAVAAGHEVEVYHVGQMKIAGCLGCEYCHTKGEGACVQKVGYYKFDKTVDRTVDDVFKKADKAMYERKVAMKAERKD